jgi:hypothetical protein
LKVVNDATEGGNLFVEVVELRRAANDEDYAVAEYVGLCLLQASALRREALQALVGWSVVDGRGALVKNFEIGDFGPRYVALLSCVVFDARLS